MNFTREPIIETVITPREGSKLVVRSSKGSGQEDYFVDAVEVVSFGHSLFFRSQEKPKPFLVPVSDYEILELRETRMVLKNVPTERALKASGGRDAPPRPSRDLHKEEPAPREETPEGQPAEPVAGSAEPRLDSRKRDRRRRGRRGRTDRDTPESTDTPALQEGEVRPENEPSEEIDLNDESPSTEKAKPTTSFRSLLFPPPPALHFLQELKLPKIVSELKDSIPETDEPVADSAPEDEITPDSEE